jgi:hypothetical protein
LGLTEADRGRGLDAGSREAVPQLEERAKKDREKEKPRRKGRAEQEPPKPATRVQFMYDAIPTKIVFVD